MSNVKHISYYTNVMQNWSKPLGPKPSEAELALAHVFGRPGKQSFVVALALRGDGVTRGQMLEACSLFDGKPTPQLNHMRALVNAKMFTRLAVPGAYAIEKGPNAQRFIDLHGAKAADKVEAETPAKPAKKAAGKRKAKKATPAAQAETPVSEPVQVTAPAPEMQATA
jgi:hypothetical protein